MKNLISIEQFNAPKDLEGVFTHADILSSPFKNIDPYYILRGKIVGFAFFEPSTRTKSSFEVAVKRLGGQTLDFLPEKSSLSKGESLEDTCKILSQYVDCLVIRHRDKSFIESLNLDIPVINAGNDTHPTQSIADLYTIKKETKKIHGSNILIVGDLKYNRSVKSLLQILKMYKYIRVHLSSPKELTLGPECFHKEIIYTIEDNPENVLPKVDVVYMTRYQKEVWPVDIWQDEKNQSAEPAFKLEKRHLDMMKKDAIIMHPLPRLEEISVEVDADSRAKYFQQAKYGLFTRMGILKEILS